MQPPSKRTLDQAAKARSATGAWDRAGARRSLAAPFLRLAAGRRHRRGLGLAIAVAVGPARGAGWALLPLRVALQQLLEVLDVADGGAERLHLAEAPARQLPWQVVSEARVPFVHAAHALPLALVALAEEGGLEGAVQRQGQVGPSPGAARVIHMQGDPEGVPQREAGQGPWQAQGHRVEVVRQGQQSGWFTFLHHSPTSQQITQEVNLSTENKVANLQSGDDGPFRLPGREVLFWEKFLVRKLRSRTGFKETLHDFVNSLHSSISL